MMKWILIDSDDEYLTNDSLIEINHIINGSYNNTSRKANVKPYGFDKLYMDKKNNLWMSQKL